jgi:hypothetical protein
MAELESKKEAAAKVAAKKKLKAQVVSKVDTSPANVVKWASEGRELFFAGGEDFLELDDEVVGLLSGMNYTRYRIERDALNGSNPVGVSTDSINGFTTNFNVRPDDPNKQLEVSGKDPGMDYHWSRPDKYEQHLREGWVVDHDTSTKTRYSESCSYKTVGGQNQPELVLMKRGKEASEADRVERKKQRDGMVKKTQQSFANDVVKTGGRPIVDASNGVV